MALEVISKLVPIFWRRKYLFNFGEMETPVLTKIQKGKSLSAKTKKKPSNNIRNVLGAVPRNNSCPTISEAESQAFKELLLEFFPYVPQVRVKWRALKTIPKEKRTDFKNSLLKNIEKPKYLDQLIVGINAVTRAIENSKVSLVLLANDVNPPLLINHVIEVCNVQGIPVIQVPQLRIIMKECVNFTAIVVGFKTCFENDPLDSVKQLFHSHIAKFTATCGKSKSLSVERPVVVVVTKQVDPPIQKPLENSDNNVYLQRNSIQVRTFVPSAPVTVQKQKEVLNFIKLQDIQDVCEGKSEPNHSYKNLKIKRVKPNPNRIKKKKKVNKS